MATPRKKAAAPEPPPMPRIGDKVKMPRIDSVLEVTYVSHDGDEVTLQRPGTNLEWFRIKADTLTFVERQPPAKTSNPFTNAEPVLDAEEALERINSVRVENLTRSDDDIDILKAYLKTQGAPKAAIEAFERLTVDLHKSWSVASKRVEQLLKN
jgi:hypothetical protein